MRKEFKKPGPFDPSVINQGNKEKGYQFAPRSQSNKHFQMGRQLCGQCASMWTKKEKHCGFCGQILPREAVAQATRGAARAAEDTEGKSNKAKRKKKKKKAIVPG
jgi:hypothetical protein